MSQKVIFTILLISLLLIGGLFLAAFMISRGDEEVSFGEALRDVAPFGDILEDARFDTLPIARDTAQKDGSGFEIVPGGVGALPDLYKISDEPVVGAVSFIRDGTEYVRFVSLDTGHIFEYGATTTKKERVTNTTGIGLKEVFWGENGSSIMVRYLLDDTIKTFLASIVLPREKILGESIGELFGDFIPDDVEEVAVSPDGDQFFYLVPFSGGSAGIVSDFKDKEKESIFNFPFSEWLILWPQKNTIILNTKPSAFVDGFAYKLDVETGDISRLIGGIDGLNTLHSPSIDKVLYSQGISSGIRTFIFNTENSEKVRLPISTLSEKCVWGSVDVETVYCGVPGTIQRGDYPDEWYQGIVSFSDSIWKLDTETNTPERLSVPSLVVEEEIDVIQPFLSKNEVFMFFINKKDSSLWSLKLGSR